MHEVLNKQIADDDGEKADHDFDLVQNVTHLFSSSLMLKHNSWSCYILLYF
jgi:hypothetical protein